MAGIKLGSTDVTAVKLGSTDIQKIYRGTDLVFELSSLDPDAQAFLTATGITDATITTAINDLVLDLKSNSLWTKMQIVYPFVGGTATTHKYNLKDPQDTDAAFRMTFNGGWTHDANGVKGNGTNTYGDTHWSAQNVSNGVHWSFNTNLAGSGGQRYDMGSVPGGDWALISNFQGTGSGTMYWLAGSGGYLTNSTSGRLGFMTGTSNGTNFRSISKNGTQQTSDTNGAIGNQIANCWFGCTQYFGGTPNNISEGRYDFCSIGEQLTSTDISNLETIQTDFNTALSR